MSAISGIEWTEATWNPVTGCTKVSPGCAHCYIERTPPFRMTGLRFVKGHLPITVHMDRLDTPKHWWKPRRVFVNSLSDLFHPDIPDAFIFDVYRTMGAAYWHTYQVLTKRPERLAALWERLSAALHREGRTRLECWRHVWHGVSVENQHWADVRIPILLRLPASVRFLSCEPLLGPLVLSQALHVTWTYSAGQTDHVHPEGFGGWWSDLGIMSSDLPKINWVIVGGESGPNARPPQANWIRSLRDQCQTAGVPFFFKQWGGRTPTSGGRVLDEREWTEYPNQEER